MSKEQVNVMYEIWFLVALGLTVVLGLLIFYFGLPRFIHSSVADVPEQQTSQI